MRFNFPFKISYEWRKYLKLSSNCFCDATEKVEMSVLCNIGSCFIEMNSVDAELNVLKAIELKLNTIYLIKFIYLLNNDRRKLWIQKILMKKFENLKKINTNCKFQCLTQLTISLFERRLIIICESWELLASKSCAENGTNHTNHDNHNG